MKVENELLSVVNSQKGKFALYSTFNTKNNRVFYYILSRKGKVEKKSGNIRNGFKQAFLTYLGILRKNDLERSADEFAKEYEIGKKTK